MAGIQFVRQGRSVVHTLIYPTTHEKVSQKSANGTKKRPSPTGLGRCCCRISRNRGSLLTPLSSASASCAAEAKGTPPINMASCVASIVTCAWPSLRARHLEGSLLQPLVPQRQAARLPPQRLEPIAAAIDEQEQVAVQHVHREHRFDNPAQPVKTPAEIDRLAAEINRRSRW